jgi:hypothetical protein
LAVHSYSLGAAWTSDREYLEHQFEPAIEVAFLAADPRFRKKTLDEIKDGPPVLKLKPLARKYVECLSTIHSDFRVITQAATNRFFVSIADARQRLADQFPDAPRMFMAIYKADIDGVAIGEKTNLSKTLTDYVAFLQQKNQKLINFSKRRVAY